MTNVETARDLFVFELEGMYYVETELVEQLGELHEEAATDALDGAAEEGIREQFRELLAEHRSETEEHVERLERVFDAIGQQPGARESTTLGGLVQEKERFTNVLLNDELRNLYYLGAAVKTERIEISGYEALLQLAGALDLPDEVTELLEANLQDERQALENLQELRESDDASTMLEAIVGEQPTER